MTSRLSDIKLHIWFDSAHHDLVTLSEVEGKSKYCKYISEKLWFCPGSSQAIEAFGKQPGVDGLTGGIDFNVCIQLADYLTAIFSNNPGSAKAFPVPIATEVRGSSTKLTESPTSSLIL